MATATQSFRYTVGSGTGRAALRQHAARPIEASRAFSTISPQWQRKPRRLTLADGINNPRQKELIAEALETMHSKTDRFKLEESRTRLKQTFMNMGDPEPWEGEHTLDDDDDDMPSLAHGELEKHREMRHYARLAAWEMPLLSKFTKSFQPPSSSMPLRFRYTSYMGEQHPAEMKVVLEFSPADMPNLTEVQRMKLKKLAGVRYNPESDVIKMSCESFPTQAQNKRYLGDIVGNLLEQARDPTDTFEDIPLDTRHHHFKPKLQFPKEWLVTEERKAELENYRQRVLAVDEQREIKNGVIDGLRTIEDGLKKAAMIPEAAPAMAVAGKGRVSVRR